MTVFVTGGAGFVGSHLCDRYLKRGDHVVAIDNLITGNARNLIAAKGSKSFDFVRADITDSSSNAFVRAARAFGKADLVLHFASPASPVDYSRFPLETMAVNSRGTQACLEYARHACARVLYASTSECYGDPLVHPQPESYWGNVNSVGPRSCYDESKRFGETLTMSYMTSYGVDVRIIRIFNTYGPRMRPNDGRVVPNFISQALGGTTLTLYGSGKQTRSFCYIDDLVEGIMLCADSKKTKGVVVNLGNPEERTIEAFAAAVADIVGVPLTTVHEPLPQDDPSRRCPDITRARDLLGWQPSVTLDEGLRATVEYFRTLA